MIYRKKILITGAAGFIGYHLSLKLSKNNELTLLDNFARNKMDVSFKNLIGRRNVVFINADLTKKEFYEKLEKYYDYVIHLAAINGTKYFYEKPYEVLRVNILSLMNMTEWVTANNTGKFLFSSSSEAYAGTISEFGENQNFLPTKEDIPLTISDIFNERFSYGGSKLIGELVVINYFKSIDCKNYTIVRYHNIYGPRMGNEHVIPEFCKRIFEKQDPFNIYGGSETRAFCYIDDAVDGTILALKTKSCDSQVLHIGNSNEEIMIETLARKLLEINHSSAQLKINTSPAGSVKRRCPDVIKLKSLTGYSPKIDIEKGLELTSAWYKKELIKSSIQ